MCVCMCVFVRNHFNCNPINFDENFIGSWTSCTTLIRIHSTMEHATIWLKLEMYNYYKYLLNSASSYYKCKAINQSFQSWLINFPLIGMRPPQATNNMLDMYSYNIIIV